MGFEGDDNKKGTRRQKLQQGWLLMVIIQEGSALEDLQIPFKSSVLRSIGDGEATEFWHDHWIGSDRLCNSFSRLYRLDLVKNASIKDRVLLVNGRLEHRWEWSRTPSGITASELHSLITLLASFSFNGNCRDRWTWNLASNGILTTKRLAALIDEKLLGIYVSPHCFIQNNLVPKKFGIFVWRLLHKRIPVRVELDKRGMDLHSVRCPLCDGDVESVDHTFISCNLARDLWVRVGKWWNLGSPSFNNLGELLKDVGSLSMSSSGRLILQATFWVCAFLIWKNRNNKVFQGKCWSTPVALNEVQIKSFEWISSCVKDKKFDWLTWISNPSVLLS
ncbi:uncharacterized protein [Rutidosis leptorrhynchoides]|uniref:uncharacterized protein n=1 Tax=Rutidosis leptorrhynchoides TaxID=125765 RepID=UPI003A99C360